MDRQEEDLSYLLVRGAPGVAVGRIVHYVDDACDGPELVAAVITAVRAGGSVDLALINPSRHVRCPDGTERFQQTAGLYFGREELDVAFSETLRRGHWSWPARA